MLSIRARTVTRMGTPTPTLHERDSGSPSVSRETKQIADHPGNDTLLDPFLTTGPTRLRAAQVRGYPSCVPS